jgi:EAL domain-containing protein (putative c-di-GMP-specific phosphodiesterase class I)
MLCQPIVQWSNQSTFAYEALVRSSEPTIAHPGALFDAADRLDRTLEIGRRVRILCGEYVGRPPDALLFVNVHTKDLMDNVIYSPDTALARMANHVVLEITERARLEIIPDAPGRIARLRSMGFRIAIDDLGAGYAGLTSFASLEPNFMKLDRSLVEGIHQSNTKMKLVGAMINACRELGVQVVGEGIETVAERDALISLGCDLLQGYLFARPEPPFTTPRF